MARTRNGSPQKLKHKEVATGLKIFPAVAALPQDFTDEQKVWWNKYVGKVFKGKIAPRGKQYTNARTWTKGKFVRDFCNDFYPRLTMAERKQYEIIIGSKVYSYLTNHSTRGSVGIAVKPKKVERRVYAHDIWRREHPDRFKKAMAKHVAQHRLGKLNVGTRRPLAIMIFQRLPSEVQEEYKRKAGYQMGTIQPPVQLEGEAKARYIAEFMEELQMLVKDAEQNGIKTAAQLVTEDVDGNLNMTILTSAGLQGFHKSSAAAQLANSFKKDMEARMGKEVRGVPPPVTVYPDPDMRPQIPDYTGMKLIEIQELCQLYFNSAWAFQGGAGRVPWAVVGGSLDDWIAPQRRPPNVILKHPKAIATGGIRPWLDYFTKCQDGSLPPERRFQFRRVIAGPSPIDRSLSQESLRRKEFVQTFGQEVWILEFENTVTKCHAPNGMVYPESSMRYAQFWANDHASSSNSNIPIAHPHTPSGGVNGQETSGNEQVHPQGNSENESMVGDSSEGLVDFELLDHNPGESEEDEEEGNDDDEDGEDASEGDLDDLSAVGFYADEFDSEEAGDQSSTCENVFGPFPPLPWALEPIPLESYEDIVSHLQSTLNQCTDVLKEWHNLASDHSILQDGDQEAVQSVVAPLNLPTVWRPLMEFLAIRRIVWKRAEKTAPSVFDVDLKMRLAAREAIRVVEVASRSYEVATAMNNPLGDDLDALGDLLTRTRMAIAELRWCHSELETMEELSTKMNLKLGDAWLRDDFPNDLRTLRDITVELSQWTNTAYHLDRRLRRNRPTLWGTSGLPFEQKQIDLPVWYWFGNPRLTELPHGLQDSLNSTLNLGDHDPELERRIDHSVARIDLNRVAPKKLPVVEIPSIPRVSNITQLLNNPSEQYTPPNPTKTSSSTRLRQGHTEDKSPWRPASRGSIASRPTGEEVSMLQGPGEGTISSSPRTAKRRASMVFEEHSTRSRSRRV